MAHLLETMRRTIAVRRLFPGPRYGVVVACSGGPDSTALSHALHRLAPSLGLSLCIASVDHGLRSESRDEVRAVGEFARALGVPFVPLAVKVAGPGLPAAARAARYDALLGLARQRDAAAVAVGHTRDDQAETVLARMLRGAGLTGLSGIEPVRPDGVVRPLIDCSRAEVLSYVSEHRLPVANDPTNRDPRFERSRIRHQLLPALEAEDPRVREHLARLADEARALADYLEGAAEGVLRDTDGDPLALSVERLGGLPAPVRVAAVRRWIERETGRPPGRAHLDAIDALFQAGGEVLLADGFEVVREGGVVVLRRRAKRRGRGERQTDQLRAERSGIGGSDAAGTSPAETVAATSPPQGSEKTSE